jgi:uncharacterized protein
MNSPALSLKRNSAFALPLATLVAACHNPMPPKSMPLSEQSTQADSAAAASATDLPASSSTEALAKADKCAKGWAASCLHLGVVYQDGALGLTQDQTRAAALYERACVLGDIRGCNNLAAMFEKGQGRPVDAKRAFVLYERNCDAKHALACKNVGRCHRDGVGVPADASKAKAAFQKAVELSKAECTFGEAQGCANLGFSYRSGDTGLPKDEARAVEYLQRACDMGYRAVCSHASSRP